MWTEKYRPETLSDFKGSSKEVQTVREWVADWSPDQSEKALLLHGPPGAGKTSLVHALANDLGMELFETNASDARKKADVQEKLAQAVKQRSFTGKQKLILVDEVDGMGRADRGGRGVINDLVDETRFPMILTANDPYASGMDTVRRKAKTVELGNVHTNSIAARLRDICEAEDVAYEDGALKAIARRANGDMRSAINDLEGLARKGRVTEEDVRQLGYRETEREIFETLKILFKTETAETASNATEGLDEDYDTVFEWIRENVPKEYTREDDVADAFDNLSQADVFKGRMHQRQHWGLLKYVYELMTVGVSLSKEEKYSGWTKYGYPSTIRKMGKSKASRATRDSIAEKISDRTHMAATDAVDMLPLLAMLFDEPALREALIDRLELEEKEIEFIASF